MEKLVLAYIMASLHEGNLEEVFHMFDFLKGNNNNLMVFDPTDPDIDLSKLPR